MLIIHRNLTPQSHPFSYRFALNMFSPWFSIFKYDFILGLLYITDKMTKSFYYLSGLTELVYGKLNRCHPTSSLKPYVIQPGRLLNGQDRATNAYSYY